MADKTVVRPKGSTFNNLRENGDACSSRPPAIFPIGARFKPNANTVLFAGDCLNFLGTLPNGVARLIVTSPPYNIGKQYERRKNFADYLAEQAEVIRECVRVLAEDGSICWQVGNFVDNNEIIPLDDL